MYDHVSIFANVGARTSVHFKYFQMQTYIFEYLTEVSFLCQRSLHSESKHIKEGQGEMV